MNEVFTAPKVLIIEVWDNGKIVCPAGPQMPANQRITLEQLKACRDYVNLMIEYPQHFHIVNTEFNLVPNGLIKMSIEDQEKVLKGFSHGNNGKIVDVEPDFRPVPPKCKCGNILSKDFELNNGVCQDCEKKQIIGCPVPNDRVLPERKFCKYCNKELNAETSPKHYKNGFHAYCALVENKEQNDNKTI